MLSMVVDLNLLEMLMVWRNKGQGISDRHQVSVKFEVQYQERTLTNIMSDF